MEENSLDFLDKLVPTTTKDESDTALGARHHASSGSAPTGRSLPPPPAAVLAAARQRGDDIDVDLSDSAPDHALPSAGYGSAEAAGPQMPWVNDTQRSPSSAPGARADRRIPLPHAAAAQGLLGGAVATDAALADADEPETSLMVQATPSGPPPAPSMRSAAPPPAPPRRSEPARSEPGKAHAGDELFANLPAPARKSGGPPPPPSLRSNPVPAGAMPHPAADPQALGVAAPVAQGTAPHAPQAPAPYAAPGTAPYAAPGASGSAYAGGPSWDDGLYARPEPELATVPLTSPVVVSPNVWSVDSVLPDPPNPNYVPPGSAVNPAHAGPSALPQASLPPAVNLSAPAAPYTSNYPAPLALPPPSGAAAQNATSPYAGVPSVAPGSTAAALDAAYAASSLPPPPLVGSGVSTSLPPLPPPPTGPTDGPNEWDEAPTAIYARESMHSVPALRGPLPKATLPPMPTLPASRAPNRLAIAKARMQQNAKWWLAGGAALLGLLLVLVWPSGDGKGELVINVAGPSGVAVDGLRIFIDDALACEDSPCQLKHLEARSHVITAEAPGYVRAAAKAVLVEAGDTTMHTLELVRAKSGTGIVVPHSPGALMLFVDGKEMGPLPQRLEDLSAGEHRVRVTGSERLQAVERNVTLQEGQLLNLDPFALPVLKGKLSLTAGNNAEDAEVKLNGKRVRLPHSAELSGSSAHSVTVEKEGFLPLKLEVKFPAGEPEQNIAINLEPEGGSVSEEEVEEDAEEAVAADQPARAKSRGTVAVGAAAKRGSAKSTAGGGTGKLTLISVPSAVVILDGRPIGKSPKRAVTVSAGTHSVVFVHPTKGRKRASAKVTAGSSKTIAVKF